MLNLRYEECESVILKLDGCWNFNGENENGNKHIMEISKDDAYRILTKYSNYVTIVYYKITKRITKIY